MIDVQFVQSLSSWWFRIQPSFHSVFWWLSSRFESSLTIMKVICCFSFLYRCALGRSAWVAPSWLRWLTAELMRWGRARTLQAGRATRPFKGRPQKKLTQYIQVILCQINTGAPVGMWTWGRVHTKFWQPPYLTLSQPGGGADYAHPILVSTPMSKKSFTRFALQ